MTILILDGKLIKLKRDVNPDLYRAIHTAIRKLSHEGLQNVTPTKKTT